MTDVTAERIARLERGVDVAILAIDSPPVNALGRGVRQALIDATDRVAADPVLRALVIRCDGRTFFPGADIREFGRPSENLSSTPNTASRDGTPNASDGLRQNWTVHLAAVAEAGEA